MLILLVGFCCANWNILKFWNQLKDLHSPGSVPRGMIIGLKVNDPRL